jgi:hypothetical protein
VVLAPYKDIRARMNAIFARISHYGSMKPDPTPTHVPNQAARPLRRPANRRRRCRAELERRAIQNLTF